MTTYSEAINALYMLRSEPGLAAEQRADQVLDKCPECLRYRAVVGECSLCRDGRIENERETETDEYC